VLKICIQLKKSLTGLLLDVLGWWKI